MIFFSIIFAFVFLVGNDATISDVPMGSCSFLEYLCSVRNCHTAFLKAFQKDAKADCSAVLSKMKDCMVDVMKFCMKDLLTDGQIKGIVDAGLKKEEQCDEPYLELPTMPPDNNLCSASYDNDANICVRSYRQKFIKDKSDRTLCSEYAESKKCFRDLIDSDCNYPTETKKMMDLYLGVHNPFCADNRDPGATKPDQCDGVLDEEDVKAAAGTKPSVFQTLMFAFFLFLFLFKA